MSQKYFTKKGHLKDMGIAAAADGLRTGDEHSLPIEIQDHFTKCNVCKTEVVDLCMLINHLEKDLDNSQSEDLHHSKRWNVYWPWAAILIAGIIIGSIYFGTIPGKTEFRYHTNAELEMLIGDTYRGDHIKIISPSTNQAITSPVYFKWKTDVRPPFELKLFNNSGDLIYRDSVTVYSLSVKKTLKPGLYYWQIDDKNDLLFTGKFIVKSE